MKIAILCPDFPPTRSGLADHTWLLALNLSRASSNTCASSAGSRSDVFHHSGAPSCDVVVITSRLAGEPAWEQANGIKVLRVVSHWGTGGLLHLAKRVESESPKWLIVQYLPHLYGRGGINLALPLLLLWLRLRGKRILLIAHELYVDFPALFRRHSREARSKREEARGKRPEIFWLRARGWFSCGKQMAAAIVQRLMLGLSLLAARCVGVSTESWTKRLWIPDFRLWSWVRMKIRNPKSEIRNHTSGLRRQARFFHLPTPSAIDPVTADREEVRRSLGIEANEIALSFFGNFHASKMRRLLIASLKALLLRGKPAKLLVIGPEYEKLLEIADEDLKREIITTGYVDRESVSRYLQASDIFLLPTIDGVSTRRSSLMAALSHALPVVATDGELTDEILRTSGALCLSTVEDADRFVASVIALADDDKLRRQLGERGRKLYEENFAWPIVTRRILEAISSLDESVNLFICAL